MSFWKRALLLIGAVASFSAALFVLQNAGQPERAQFTGRINPGGLAIAPEIQAIAPPFELHTLTGDTLNLAALRGAPVLINFWATWCEPCRVEMPALQAMYETYQEKGLRIIAVNLGETRETARSWVQIMNLTFDILLDPQQAVAALYQLRGQPSTYVISPNGVVTSIFYGPVSEQVLHSVLAAYFPN